MNSLITVIIPTYNPNLGRLSRVLEALSTQQLNKKDWELIIVDNNSSNAFSGHFDLSWHPNHQLLKEERQGLTYARLKGFEAAQGSLIVMVDDDNLLAADYLTCTINIFDAYPQLGAIGGIVEPEFEVAPPAWLQEFYSSLALRNLGTEPITESWAHIYPPTAPIGAGMAIRKQALQNYIVKHQAGYQSITDRTGSSLSSGGDNDIIIELLKAGWQVGYFPNLKLQHIIPDERIQVSYLARLNHDSSQSWMELLNHHQMNSWASIPGWTVPLRQLKAWFTYKAWAGPSNYIKWRGACGMFKGLVKQV